MAVILFLLYANDEFDRWLINDNNSICYVGLIDGKPMATGAFDGELDQILKISGYNTLLWVEEEFRGNNYGKILSEIRYEWALNHNYKIIYLDTINAYDYHIKMGWILKNKITHNNVNYSIMQKILDTKLSFEISKNIYDYSEILKPLADEFTTLFYQTMLVWCSIIESDNAQGDKLWELWLVKLGNKTIGICGLYTLKDAVDTKELWLGWLGIIPELRNMNFGSQIMNHLYINAKNVGCERLLSYVDKDGKPLNFYKKEGFEIIGTVGEYCKENNISFIDGEDFEDTNDYVIIKNLL